LNVVVVMNYLKYSNQKTLVVKITQGVIIALTNFFKIKTFICVL